MKGLIYLVTNKINNKIYIGKTKTHYGDGKEFGVDGRFDVHFKNAKSTAKKTRNECPRFYNAIRKYGDENFSIETLLTCEVDEYDDKETEMIAKYDATNRDIGYNIALGGRGCAVQNVSEEARQAISKAHDPNGMHNIREIRKKNILIGYRVKRKNKCVTYTKQFSSTKNTVEENLELAKKWLDDLKLTDYKCPIIKYNKSNDLPKYIMQKKDKKGKCVGYRIQMPKTKEKIIMNKSKTLEELLAMAIEYKEEYTKTLNAK
ncbi:MAG: GIY-YIG-like endonuclease [Edafosvirus sp.]|uniref:GIY-YIG-like endonuclease n=1 Tax=Edafosvirus sp. TaxID=2487765 RepID=A0A3G4ZUU3_9VIRU|nr:MAG: GIY-YIG-like endonuclease [Edafosvirus sp.]